MAACQALQGRPATWASLTADSSVVFEMALDGSHRDKIMVPADMSATSAKTAEGKRVLRLCGGDAAARAHGRTGGFSICLPDGIEAAASGKRVRVTVSARAAQDRRAELSLAYSTNEVGNSGWRKFAVGEQFEPKSFDFEVPRMKNGNGDYVGILPGPGPGVEIEKLNVEVLSRA